VRHFDEYGIEVWPGSSVTYIVIEPDPTTPDARTLVGGVDVDLTDGGPGSTLTIDRAGNVILLFDSGGAALAEYAMTDEGLTAALAAMASGDIVQMQAGTISGSHVVPAGGTLRGRGERSILTGPL